VSETTLRRAAAAGGLTAGREPRWLYPLLLAAPFLVGVAVLKGLTVEIDTFHGSDARVYHLPTIEHFADRLDFDRYPAAQTPLYHLLFAAWGNVAGFELWRLRLLNVAISYGAVLVLYRLLIARVGLERPQAFALALLFELSPYVFGASFTLLTDNLAILFGLLALERFDRFRGDPALVTFALGCVAMSAAVLTRQSFVWLVPVAAYVLLQARPPGPRLAAGVGAGVLALAPLAALVVVWGGLVPPGSDPASCGLCTDRPGVGRDALTLRTVGFTFAVLGLYAAALYGPVLVRRARELRSRLSAAVLLPPLAAGAALLLVSPLEYRPIEPGIAGDAGYLWKLSDNVPLLASSSLLFWGLVPLGALAFWRLARRAGLGSLPVVYFASFLIAALPVRLVYQKYFDPFALLALALLVSPRDLRAPLDYAGATVLAVGFVAYALSFAG
jgi:hypothetical protein